MEHRSTVVEMSDLEKDETPMLSEAHAQYMGEPRVSYSRGLISRGRSASLSIPMDFTESYQTENNLVNHTGPLRNEKKIPFIQMSGPLFIGPKSESLFPSTPGVQGPRKVEPRAERFPSFNGMEWNNQPHDNYAAKNEHLLRSGQLGVCNDPYCTICPTHFISSRQEKNSKFQNAFYGDARGKARRLFSCLQSYVPGIMNPHTIVVQRWNRFFVISCLLAIFVDPLFFLLLSVQKVNKCIMIDLPMTKTIVVFRSLTDFIYLLNMLLQFRLAYVAPESTVVGAGDLVDHPKKIAAHYLRGYFLVDLFIVLPLPQIIVLLVLPMSLGSSGANYAKNLLRLAVLIQYIPRLYRFLPFLVGQSPSGFIFESAWANFVINLLTFMLAGHVVGSCWYLFGLQRVNQCLRDACHDSNISRCMDFIDCGHGEKISEFNHTQEWPQWPQWRSNENATACFSDDGFNYGIYSKAVNLTTKHSIVTRYTYSLFWGFQQISTLAGNQVPSYFIWEVIFTMAIIGLGLLLFALLIGNMQNFLQALGRRRLEMTLRRRDVEQWMSHRRLPGYLRRQVRQAERYNWAATRGVNEEMLMDNLPEDLQREIRRHLFKFLKNVHIFSKMGDSKMGDTILDTICERLRQRTYIKGSKILVDGVPIEKMVFIVRGKMSNGVETPLGEGDVCGEELLAWCIENSSVNKDGNKIKFSGNRLLSNRNVECLTNVEAFILRAADIEEVTGIFSRFLRNPKVQGAIRYQSPYWRSFAATRIQVAWRYRKKRLSRVDMLGAEFNRL